MSQSQQPTPSWGQVFFDEFNALPASETDFSSIEPRKFMSFKSNDMKFFGPIRFDRRHPISVWRAKMAGKDVVVKEFNQLADSQINMMLRRFPEVPHDAARVRNDMDSFALEKRVYDRIDRIAPERKKAFFLHFYGVLDERGIVLELVRPSLRSRCICSSSIPSYLNEDLRLLREVSPNNMKPLENRWYESLLIDRLKRLTALHSIGVTHGDIKEDHFRLRLDFHDTVLFDFSHAYAITPERPYMVQGHVIDSRYASRFANYRSMQKLVERERRSVRDLVIKRREENSFLQHFEATYNLSRESLTAGSQPDELELIAMKIFRTPEEFIFPSLASILPFLEEAAKTKPSTWVVSRANSLEHYTALWVQQILRSPQSDDDIILISAVYYTGQKMFSQNSAPLSDSARKRYFLFLIPAAWVEQELQITMQIATNILSTRPMKEKAWTVDKTIWHDFF